jgi:RHS repeat-associated protein
VGNWYEVTNGAVTKYYYFGSQRVAMRNASGVTYLHGDHLGSTSVASTDTGAFHSRQTYYAFGVPRTTEGTLPTDYTFTGQRKDNSAGLMYYNARYYDSYLNRWTQPDTIVANPFDPQELNRYSYARNNPVRYTDPSGHCPFCIVGALGGALGGAIYGYGIQVANNLNNNNMGWNALTTNIDPNEVVMYTVAGTVIGGTLGIGIELAAPLFTTATAAEVTTATTGATAACAQTNCATNVSASLQTVEEALPAVEQAASTGRVLFDSLNKSDAKSILRVGLEGISNEQTQSLLERLNKGRVDSFSLRLLENGDIQAIAERAGKDGFQRLTYTIDPSGKVTNLIQEGINAAGKVIHVHDWINDNIIQ